MTTKVLMRPVTFAQRAEMIQDNLGLLQTNIANNCEKSLNADAIILVQVIMKQLRNLEQSSSTRLEIHFLFRLQKKLLEMLIHNVYTNRQRNGTSSNTV